MKWINRAFRELTKPFCKACSCFMVKCKVEMKEKRETK